MDHVKLNYDCLNPHKRIQIKIKCIIKPFTVKSISMHKQMLGLPLTHPK